MANETYLVTGAAGFIGSHLVEALLARGCRVVGLDNFDPFYDPAIKRENVEQAAANPAYTLVEGDIRDSDLVMRLMESVRPDTVVHLAARAGVRPSIEDPLLYQSVNIEGTNVILEAMRASGIRRLLFASSSSVYGNQTKVPFSESDNVDHPISPYAATKKACELLCYTYHHLYGIDAACLRFFTVYGPRQRPEMAIHKFIRLIEAGRPVPIFGDGGTSRDYTYIDDIIQGILAIAGSFSGYEVINLGESQPVGLTRLVEVIAEELERTPRIERLPMQSGDVETTFADITRARSHGYAPVTSIEKGVRSMVEWFRRQNEIAAQDPGNQAIDR
jgi:UDP-glucuronate 4-epimerase